MRQLRLIRVLLSTVMFAAAVGYLALGLTHHPLAEAEMRVQIVPSLLAQSVGVALFWLVVTLCFGRVYCSSVCPIGTLQDLVMPLRRVAPRLGRLLPRRTFRYRAGSRLRYEVLLIYLICTLLGVAVVSALLEPWSLMTVICGMARPSLTAALWGSLGLGAAFGILAGAVSLLLIVFCAIYFGRDFCTRVCPLGTVLGLLDNKVMYHIAIDPDRCVSCMKCEEACRSSCIKVSERLVDNTRCVRCFDCLAVCDDDAIVYRRGRFRAATPLMQGK